MQLGPDEVLLTAAVQFRRGMRIDEVETAIERLEKAVAALYPSIRHIYFESRRAALGDDDALASSFATTYAGVVAFIAVVHEGSFAGPPNGSASAARPSAAACRSWRPSSTPGCSCARRAAPRSRPRAQLFFENCRPGVDRIMQSVEEMRDLRSGAPRGSLRIRPPSASAAKWSRRCWPTSMRCIPTSRST
jgi:hypothetical protein